MIEKVKTFNVGYLKKISEVKFQIEPHLINMVKIITPEKELFFTLVNDVFTLDSAYTNENGEFSDESVILYVNYSGNTEPQFCASSELGVLQNTIFSSN